MPHRFSSQDFQWDGFHLRLHSGRILASIERDPKWPAMWRVHLPEGQFTDLANFTRARDAAISLALASLDVPYVCVEDLCGNERLTPKAGPQSRWQGDEKANRNAKKVATTRGIFRDAIYEADKSAA